jgi:adenylate cyclase
MTLSRRDRYLWRIFLWVLLVSAVVSAGFGIRVAPPEEWWLRSAAHGAITSLLIATPILLLELRGGRMAVVRRLRRRPLVVFLACKMLFYFVAIVGGLLVARQLLSHDVVHYIQVDPVFRKALVFSVAMAVVGTLFFEISGLIGMSTLKNLVTGRYVQPKTEQRTFLLIDMKDSTGMAERLGAVRFHELLNHFFRDIADAALECDAEIHKYVGDEAILTWSGDAALADGFSLLCPFIARDFIARQREQYLAAFGAVPEFRAALHCGEIVAGEIGDVRREIAYVGDTLNVAARLLDATKSLKHDILVSADLLKVATLPPGLKSEELPMLAIRGRIAPLGIAALERA